MGLHRSQSALGAFFRRKRAQLGTAEAVLRTHTPYADLGVDHFDQTYRARVVQSLSRRAAALGYSLQPTEVP